MAARPGPSLPLQERLAVQAEAWTRKGASGTWQTVRGTSTLSQPAITKVLNGALAKGVRDDLLRAWKVTLPELLRRHDALIRRIEHAEAPEQTLRAVLENKPDTGARTAQDAAAGAVDAADALVELDGVGESDARALVLELMSSGAATTPLELYRAARRRLARASSRSSSPRA